MSSKNIAQIDWLLWERLYSVLIKTGVDFYTAEKNQRSEAEQAALDDIHGVLNSHYNLVHTINGELTLSNNGTLKPLIKGQAKISPVLIRGLMKAFKKAQLALEPVRPFVAKEIAAAFAADQAATDCLTPVETQEPVSHPRRRRDKVASLAL